MPTEMERMAARLAADAILADIMENFERVIMAAILGGDEAAFRGRVSEKALERARELAHTAAESLMRDLTEAQLRTIGDTIAQALEEGVRPRDIGRLLDDVTMLDSNRARRYEKFRDFLENSDYSDEQIQRMLEAEYQRLLRERRETIANTEGHYATSAARRFEAENSGRNMKLWIAREDEFLCDICYENLAAGPIPIDDVFPSGDIESPAHPNCRCAVTYFKDSPTERAYYNARTQERIAAANAARGTEE